MTRELRIALIAMGGLMVLGLALYASLFALGALPRLGFAPGYALTDAQGARLTSEDLRGHVVLYAFAAADAPPGRDPAPVLRAVQDALAGQEEGSVPVRLVSVVLDADPHVLPRVAETAGADPARWLVATADPEPLRTAVRDGFGVWYEKREDGAIAFDPAFVLADGMGIVRARYRVGLPDPERLLADVRSVVREAEASRGAARLAYEAAHLFRCYPPR